MNKNEFKQIIREELNNFLTEDQNDNVELMKQTLVDYMGAEGLLDEIIQFLPTNESFEMLESIASHYYSMYGVDFDFLDNTIDESTINEDFDVPFKQGKLRFTGKEKTIQVLKPIAGGEYDVIKQWEIKPGIEMTPQLLSTLAKNPTNLKDYVVAENNILTKTKQIDELHEKLRKLNKQKDKLVNEVKQKIKNNVSYDKNAHNKIIKKINETISLIETKIVHAE